MPPLRKCRNCKDGQITEGPAYGKFGYKDACIMVPLSAGLTINECNACHEEWLSFEQSEALDDYLAAKYKEFED